MPKLPNASAATKAVTPRASEAAITAEPAGEKIGAAAAPDAVGSPPTVQLIAAPSTKESVSTGSCEHLVGSSAQFDDVIATSGADEIPAAEGEDPIIARTGQDHIPACGSCQHIVSGSPDPRRHLTAAGRSFHFFRSFFRALFRPCHIDDPGSRARGVVVGFRVVQVAGYRGGISDRARFLRGENVDGDCDKTRAVGGARAKRDCAELAGDLLIVLIATRCATPLAGLRRHEADAVGQVVGEDDVGCGVRAGVGDLDRVSECPAGRNRVGGVGLCNREIGRAAGLRGTARCPDKLGSAGRLPPERQRRSRLRLPGGHSLSDGFCHARWFPLFPGQYLRERINSGFVRSRSECTCYSC